MVLVDKLCFPLVRSGFGRRHFRGFWIHSRECLFAVYPRRFDALDGQNSVSRLAKAGVDVLTSHLFSWTEVAAFW